MKLKYKKIINELGQSTDELNLQIYQQWALCNGVYNIKEEFFYANLKKMKPIDYKYPKFLKDKTDRDLLLRLICASPDLEYAFVIFKPKENEPDDKIPELVITMENNGECEVKKISELSKLQIKSLFKTLLKGEITRYYHFIKSGDQEALKVITECLDYLLNKYEQEIMAIKNFQSNN
jgi:hypothetical protein